jgi:hypothetical protein
MPGKRLPGFVLRIPFSIFNEFGALTSGKRNRLFLFRVLPCPQPGVGRLTTTFIARPAFDANLRLHVLDRA